MPNETVISNVMSTSSTWAFSYSCVQEIVDIDSNTVYTACPALMML